MHEMGIALQVIKVVEQSLPPVGSFKVKMIKLRLGKLTAVVPASLTMCLEVAGKGTVVEDAELVFVEVPVVLKCGACGAETEVDSPPFVCGGCGGLAVQVISGREMIVESLEVEEISAAENQEKQDAD